MANFSKPALCFDIFIRSRSFLEIKKITLETLRYLDIHSILCVRTCFLLKVDSWILLDGFFLNEHLRDWMVIFCLMAILNSNKYNRYFWVALLYYSQLCLAAYFRIFCVVELKVNFLNIILYI